MTGFDKIEFTSLKDDEMLKGKYEQIWNKIR